jgi:predicted metal-dependent hydrolase
MTSKEYKCKCIAIIITLFILYLLYCIFYKQEPFINHNIGEKSFLVLERKPEYEKAASILNIIDNNILQLIDYTEKKYSYIHKYDNNPKNQLLFNIVDRMKKTYRSVSLRENFPNIQGKDVSYNVNKGDDISLCLRNYDDPTKFHDINDILFVALHELAHSCNESYGHDLRFWKIFRIILENAIEIDIYKNINYKYDNVYYCSMHITYNPIFDKSLDDINYFK